LIKQCESQKEFDMNYVDRDTYGMYRITTVDGPGPALMGAGTLTGNDVFNKAGDDLGDIKEFMLDMRTGRVSYAVLSFGGFLGMGDRLFAVPFDALVLDTVNKRFTLDVNKERLETAPGFDQDNWPNMADQTWAEGVHAYYGTKPYQDSAAL
jgi:sporulation protein YlmC with PRC-barrel domain